MEALEELIKDTIVDAIKEGASDAKVKKLVDQAIADLDEAKTLVQ